jgi:fatty-acid desaturase
MSTNMPDSLTRSFQYSVYFKSISNNASNQCTISKYRAKLIKNSSTMFFTIFYQNMLHIILVVYPCLCTILTFSFLIM